MRSRSPIPNHRTCSQPQASVPLPMLETSELPIDNSGVLTHIQYVADARFGVARREEDALDAERRGAVDDALVLGAACRRRDVDLEVILAPADVDLDRARALRRCDRRPDASLHRCVLCLVERLRGRGHFPLREQVKADVRSVGGEGRRRCHRHHRLVAQRDASAAVRRRREERVAGCDQRAGGRPPREEGKVLEARGRASDYTLGGRGTVEKQPSTSKERHICHVVGVPRAGNRELLADESVRDRVGDVYREVARRGIAVGRLPVRVKRPGRHRKARRQDGASAVEAQRKGVTLDIEDRRRGE
mmetsp:Transcript_18166/g.59899  ORF Transcript_18166/g.59899 Transcript_18166/m.59899 type:complete len:304 (+) Transcript_18166:3052-3963(+)